jgi:outer membrane exchange protein TraA
MLLLLFAPGVASAAIIPVSVTGDPVAPVPSAAGTGLCSTTAISSNPSTDFPSSSVTFVSDVNAFVDGAATTAQAQVATPLDLSNGDTASNMASFGDFTGAVASCPTPGCPFAVNDTTTSFGARLRGFLAVSPAMIGVQVHFGFYVDDAVAFTIFDAAGTAYPVVVRPPALGTPTFRATNTVTFAKAGLYPIEILYAQFTDHAALEASMLISSSFTDFSAPLGSGGSDLATPPDSFTLLAPVGVS